MLASASSARLGLLRAAGIDPIVAVSGVDEDAALREAEGRLGPLRPADAALVLARAKCVDVAARPPTGIAGPAVVLGCDSLLDLDGVAYGKPVDVEDAARRWRLMSGRTGLLHTGHWLVDLAGGGCVGRTVSTEVTFASVTEDDIAAYVGTGEPLGCAGAFTIDGYGGAYVTSLNGDHHNVIGLALPELRSMVTDLGYPWQALWR